MCPSSGELTVSRRHWYISFRGWLSGLLVGMRPGMGTQLPETCTEVETDILRSSVHLVGFI